MTFSIVANRFAWVHMLKQVGGVTNTLAFHVNQKHMSISVNYRPLMFINYPYLNCIKTTMTTDQLTNHGTWCGFHN